MKTIKLNSKHNSKYSNLGLFAQVDNDDYGRAIKHNWCIKKCGINIYATTAIRYNGKRTTMYLHRFIMNACSGEIIDHKDNNGLNCRKNNLRKCTHSQNLSNKISKPNSTSKHKGVSWISRDNKWLAQIQYNNKHIRIGSFFNEIEAAKAYNEKAILFHGEFAKLNTLC